MSKCIHIFPLFLQWDEKDFISSALSIFGPVEFHCLSENFKQMPLEVSDREEPVVRVMD